jgi:hypothetical protein
MSNNQQTRTPENVIERALWNADALHSSPANYHRQADLIMRALTLAGFTIEDTLHPAMEEPDQEIYQSRTHSEIMAEDTLHPAMEVRISFERLEAEDTAPLSFGEANGIRAFFDMVLNDDSLVYRFGQVEIRGTAEAEG